MRRIANSTFWASVLSCALLFFTIPQGWSASVSIQNDGSLVVTDSTGSVSDFVKEGTPRQSVQVGNQSCNVSYGFNSAGRKTILLASSTDVTAPVVFVLGENQVTIPPKSALRITLGSQNKIERLDGNPPDSVRFSPLGSPSRPAASSESQPPTQTTPTPSPSKDPPIPETSANSPSAAGNAPVPSAWPGKLLQPPLTGTQMEEDQFFARTDFGPRFVSSLPFVSVTGPTGNPGLYNQKQVAFSTGYRQDISLGVWLTDWFGLAMETGFALNAVRGNTQGMTVDSTTFWTVPLLAQICFQYPNESGWIPYLNFGFGGGWTIMKVGGINYTVGGQTAPTLSGTGNAVNNAYQIAAGVRYRLYEELSLSLAYKFYGNSQANINLDNGIQATLGSPVTQSVEAGVNFSF